MNLVWDPRQDLSRLISQPRSTKTAAQAPHQSDHVPDPTLELIIYNPQYRVLICTEHHYALQNLSYHLLDKHCLSLRQRKAIIARYATSAVVKPDLVQTPAGTSQPIFGLPAPIAAYQCLADQCYVIYQSYGHMRQHANREHGWRKSVKQPDFWVPVMAQTFFQGRRHIKYFAVQEEPAVPKEQIPPQRPASEQDAFDEMEAEEEQRLLQIEEDAPTLDDQLEHDQNTDWLRGCGWPTWFVGKSLMVIVSAASLPTAALLTDLLLGEWHGQPCVSTLLVERVLQRVLQATEIVLARCEETVRETPRVFRCWLKSWTPSFVPYPFELLQREGSRRRYFSYWRKFICYVYRIHHLSVRLKERPQDLTGLHLTALQVQMMTYVWHAFAAISPLSDPEPEVHSFPLSALEHLFQMFVIFWTQIGGDGAMDRCAIVHFSGVLGIHPRELMYRSAYDYTPYLSALIWIGRLVILEYGLPLRSYTCLPMVWPDRTAYSDQARRIRDEIRPQYLQRGSVAPIGYLIERLQHGRAIAKREGPKTNISWSLDGQLLEIGNNQIRMSEFRATVHSSIARAQ
jgi:hypothetical protein